MNVNETTGSSKRLHQVGDAERIDVTTEFELLDAVDNLRPNQTLRLQMNEVQMNEILVIDVSGVTIRGRKNRRTVIRCPAGEPAMRIWAPNIIIQSVTFEGCHDESAIVIDATSTSEGEVRFVDVEFLGNGWEGKPALGGAVRINGCDSGPCTQFSVAFRSCRFLRNAATFGGALFVRGVDVSIEDSLFESNAADLCGGAVYLDGRGQAGLSVRNSAFSNNTAGNEAHDNQTSDLRQELITTQRLEDAGSAGKGGAIRAHLFDVMSIEESTFTHNDGCYGAGALSLLQGGSGQSRPLSFSISKSTFVHNRGFCSPLLIDRRIDNVLYTLSDTSTFGGAVNHDSQMDTSIDWIVKDSTFQLNEGTGGGGLFIQATSTSRTEYRIQYSNFSQNSAVQFGGSILIRRCVLRMVSVNVNRSHAMYGGGLFAWTHSTLLIDRSPEGSPPTTIENNVAIYAGGFGCARTRYVDLSSLVLRGNMASRRGGGMQGYQTDGPMLFRGIRIENNMALLAGGIDLEFPADFKMTSDAGEPSIIKENKAVVGAGLLYSIGTFLQTKFEISDTKFSGNRAFCLKKYSQLTDRLEKERRVSLISPRELEFNVVGEKLSREEMLRFITDFPEGHGGALAMDFQRSLSVSVIDVELVNIEVRGNEAVVGGGISFRLPNFSLNVVNKTSCDDSVVGLETCQILLIVNSTFVQNKAKYAPAIYTSVADGLAVGCNRSLTVTASVAVASNATVDDALEHYCTEIGENEATGIGLEGSDFGTPAYGLVVANWSGQLMTVASGEPLAIPCRDEPQKPCPLEILIKDVFNQTISSGIGDAGLKVSIESNHVRGAKKYAAKNGVVTIDETITNGINITEELFIFSESDRRLNLTLMIRTRACLLGEIEQGGGRYLCYECPRDFYSFDPKDSNCRRCEINSLCNGSASRIPRDGYWHSTPFSPVFRRCLRRGACRFDGRSQRLSEFLHNLTTAEEEFRHLKRYVASKSEVGIPNFNQYTQCGEGYKGILCGSCMKGYSHASSGACKACSGNPAVRRLLIVGTIGLLTLVVSVNAVITLISMNSRFLLVDMEARGHHRDVPHELKRSPPVRRSLSIENLFRGQPSGSGILEDEIENEEQNEMLHSRLVATVRLAETLKIFMNYLQVNSAALYLQTSWNAVINGILSGEATVAGLSGSLFSVPLECSFEDQDSIPASIAAFWMRLAIPWIVLGILLLLFLAVWLILQRRGVIGTRNTGERFITCAIVISIVSIYFSFITIIRELLRAVNCVKIDPAESYVASDHPYIQYAIETSSKRVWAEDTAVICYEGPHLAVGIVGYIGLFLMFCLVLGIIAWLPLNKKKVMKKYFIERYWFLYQAYRSQWHTTAWESTILVRKGLVAAVIVFSVQMNPTLQLSMCVGILTAFLILQAWFSPFNIHEGFDNIPEYSGAVFRGYGLAPAADFFLSANNAIHLNHLELSSLFSSITVFYSGIVLLDSDTTPTGTWFMVSFTVFINVTFALYMVFRLYYGSHLVLDKYLALLDDDLLDDFENSLSIKCLLKKAMAVGRSKMKSGRSSAIGQSSVYRYRDYLRSLEVSED